MSETKQQYHYVIGELDVHSSAPTASDKVLTI